MCGSLAGPLASPPVAMRATINPGVLWPWLGWSLGPSECITQPRCLVVVLPGDSVSKGLLQGQLWLGGDWWQISVD